MSRPTAGWARDEKDDGADHSDCPCRDLPVDSDESNFILRVGVVCGALWVDVLKQHTLLSRVGIPEEGTVHSSDGGTSRLQGMIGTLGTVALR